MLRKLFKYEFIACGRQLAPLYALTIVLAAAIRLSFMTEKFVVISMSLFTLICTAVAVMTLVILVQRFSKNVLGEEGYLTMTLPVKISSIIWAKFLNALVYIFFGMIVACVAFAIEADLYQVLPYIFNADAWRELFGILGEIPGQVYLVMVNYVIIGILGTACPILLAYLSMSLTQLAVAGKYRTAIACVVFVVLSIALAQIGGHLYMNLPWERMYLLPEDTTSIAACHALNITIGISNLLLLAVSALCFVGTNYILKNKLNLE